MAISGMDNIYSHVRNIFKQDGLNKQSDRNANQKNNSANSVGTKVNQATYKNTAPATLEKKPKYTGPSNSSYHGPTNIPANGGRPSGGTSWSSGNSSSSSGSSGSYSYSTGGNADVNGLYQSIYGQQLSQQQAAQQQLSDQLRSQQEAYEAKLRAQQEAQRQAAQNAYNNNMSALEAAYAKRMSGLDSNLASTRDQLASSYGNSRTNLQQNEENALREAYINRMMNEKNLKQQLNAQGLTGGASESAIASMLNNYGTSRNNIQNTASDNLRELEQTYNSNLAAAQQKYNDAVNSANDSNMAYRMQLENDLANNTVSSYQDFYNALANMDSTYTNAMSNLINNQSSANADLQNTAFKAMLENAMAPTTLSVSGSSKTSSSGNSSNTLVKRVKNMRDNGYVAADIAYSLAQEGYTIPQIEQMFAEAGIEY